MWPFSKKAAAISTEETTMSANRTVLAASASGVQVYTVTPSQAGLGYIVYSDGRAILLPEGKITLAGDPSKVHKSSSWRPNTGWSPLELIAAGFPPPQEPDRPVVEQLAIAVLRGDKTAWRPLIDAALEALDE